MAHNAYIRALGVWNATTDLLSSEMATVDLRQYQAINGDLGGVWAPSAVITIGGASGLSVTGPFSAVDASMTIPSGKTLTLASGATLAAANGSFVNVAGLLTVTSAGDVVIDAGSTTTISGDVLIVGAGTLTISDTGAGTSELSVETVMTLETGSTTTANDNSFVNLNGDTTFGSTAVVVGHASSSFALHGANTLDGTQAISGTTTIDDTVSVLTGATFTFNNGSTTVAQSTAPWNLDNVVTNTNEIVTEGELTVKSVMTIEATAAVARGGPETRTAKVTLSGTGAYLNVRITAGSNADTTYDCREFDILAVPALSANIVYTISNLAAGDRVVCTVDRNAGISGFTLTLRRDDLTDFATFASAQGGACQIYWNGSTWNKLVFSAGVS